MMEFESSLPSGPEIRSTRAMNESFRGTGPPYEKTADLDLPTLKDDTYQPHEPFSIPRRRRKGSQIFVRVSHEPSYIIVGQYLQLFSSFSLVALSGLDCSQSILASALPMTSLAHV
jgi:hypothetical protein